MTHRCMDCGSDNCTCSASPVKKQKMKHWIVVFHVDATGSITVKAKTAAQAKRIAEEKFFPGDNNTELGDPIKIVDCIECTEEEYKRSDRCE